MSKPLLELTGTNGNAFSILAKARRIANENSLDWEAIEKEAKSGDYDHLLQTLMEHFEVA